MQLLTGYAKPVLALVVTPDGRTLFSVAQGQTMIWQWDLASAKVTRKLKCGGNSRDLEALALSPAGDILVSAAEMHGVVYWPLDGGQSHRLDTPGNSTSSSPGVAVHPSSPLVAASFHDSDRNGVQTWDVRGDRHVIRTGHGSYVDAVAFSPDGSRFATASRDNTVRLWVLDSAEPGEVLPTRVATSRLSFRPDGKALAAAGARSVFVFVLPSNEALGELTGHGGNVKALAYSPDGKHLASAALDGVVILRDAKTNAIVGQRHLGLGKLTSLVWLPDSRGLIVGGEKLIAVCELAEMLGTAQAKPKSRGEPLSLAGHRSRIEGLSYSRDGRTLVSWDRWNSWHVWDLSGGAGQAKDATPERFPSFGHPEFVSWSPDSTRLALTSGSSSAVGSLLTWQTQAIGLQGHYLSHLAFTPGGQLFLGLVPKSAATRFELRDGLGERVLFAARIDLPGDFYVTRSDASADDRRIYAAVGRHGVYRWTPEADEVVRVFAQGSLVTHLSLREDERRALTTGGNTAFLWSLPDGKKLLELKHLLLCSGAALLPGERVITACYDGVVRVWDATGGSELHAFDLGMGRIYRFAVAPDHMTFAAGVHKKDRIVLMDVPE